MGVLTDGELRLLLTAIEKRTGIHHRPDQVGAISKTIARVMRDSGIEQTEQFLIALDRDHSVFHRLVEAITIGETYFFREPKHFDFVRDSLIPQFRRRHGDASRLRAWSAACSSGEEAYSLAILCHELDQPVDILATDIAPESIAEAGLATYRDWSFRGESLRRVRPYLMPGGTENQRTLTPTIRRLVRFRLLNLVQDEYPETKLGTTYLNLIFCRNVLIYFDPETSRKIAAKMAQCLAPGGWLITASTDLSLSKIPGVTAITNEWGTFYRKQESQPSREREAPADPNNESRSGSPQVHPATVGRTERRERLAPTELAAGVAPSKIDASTDDAARGHGSESKSPPTVIPTSIEQQLQSLRQSDLPSALSAVAKLAESHPLESSVHYQHGRLLMESGRAGEAAKAVQKALFLDQTAIMSHFLFGTIQIDRGQWESAERHLQNARQFCQALGPEAVVPMSDDMTAIEVLAAVESQILNLPHHPG